MALERVEISFDTGNKNWSRSYGNNRLFLQANQNWANQLLAARGFVTLNEVFDMLSLPQTEGGATTGWAGNIEVDFGDEADIPPPGNSIKLSFNVNSTNVFRDKK
jgi:hypothetical protein